MKDDDADRDKDKDDDKGMSDEAINRIVKAERRRREQAEKLLADKQAEFDALKAANLSDAERKEREQRQQIFAEAEAKYAPLLKAEKTMRLVERTLSAKKADMDSWKFLDLSTIETEDDAETAVAALLETKPHLVLAEQAPKEPTPFQPGVPGRPTPARSGPQGVAGFITRAQVREWTADPKLYAEKKDLINSSIREGKVLAE